MFNPSEAWFMVDYYDLPSISHLSLSYLPSIPCWREFQSDTGLTCQASIGLINAT